MTFDQLLDKLEGVRRNGNTAMARCPAHEDKTPSLSIRPIEGQILLYCHAGCDTRDVLAALDLGWADLFDNPKGVDYRYSDGRIVHRTPAKRFRQSGNTNGTPQLYRLQQVQEAVAAGHNVWLVEGEKDVHALESLGVVATTAPMGAVNVAKCDLSPLHGASLVVIPDQDEAGQRWLGDVLAALDGKAHSITVGYPAIGKDAADHIAAGRGLADFQRVETPDAEQNTRNLFPTLDWHELWAREDVDEEWIVEPLLPARRLVALYSAPKIGKSLLMLEVAAAIAAGKKVLGITPAHRRVLYVDLENDPVQDTRERLKAMGYKPADLDDLRVMSFPSLAYLDTPQGGQELLMAANAWECQVIIIDTVSRVVKGEENDNDTWLGFYRHTGLAMKQAGMTLIRLDHTGKDATKGQRGGSAKSGDVDAVWRLDLEGDGILSLRCEAHRFPLNEQDKFLTLERVQDPLRHQVSTDARRRAVDAAVARVMQVLDRALVPADMGRDGVRAELKARGESASNVVLSEAIRRRKLAGNMSEIAVRETRGQVIHRDLSAPAADSHGQDPPETAPDLHKDLSADSHGQPRTGVSQDCPPFVPPHRGDSGQDTSEETTLEPPIPLHPKLWSAADPTIASMYDR